MHEWIDVKDRLPELGQQILTAYDSGEVTKDVYITDDHTGEQKFLFEDVYGKVTHWMPLPKHPNETKEESENA